MICCRECVKLLIDFVDQDLDVEIYLQVEEHLEACQPCMAYAQSYRFTMQLPRKLQEKRLPPELVQRLHKALAPHCGAQQLAPPPP